MIHRLARTYERCSKPCRMPKDLILGRRWDFIPLSALFELNPFETELPELLELNPLENEFEPDPPAIFELNPFEEDPSTVFELN